MKLRTVKKVIKEFMIKGRWTPLAKKVTLDHLNQYADKMLKQEQVILSAQMKAVKIKWIDSCASNMEWIFPADLEGEVQPIHITTYGVIVQDNENTLVVAQNYGTDPEQFCSLMTIPKGCIQEIMELS